MINLRRRDFLKGSATVAVGSAVMGWTGRGAAAPPLNRT